MYGDSWEVLFNGLHGYDIDYRSRRGCSSCCAGIGDARSAMTLRTVLIGAGALAAALLGWRAASWRSAPALATYIDPRQCRACHAAISRDYARVGMARSFARVSNASPIEDYERNNNFFHALSGRHYQMLRRGGRVFQRRYELDSHGNEANVFE